jgi:hypothetical protein
LRRSTGTLASRFGLMEIPACWTLHQVKQPGIPKVRLDHIRVVHIQDVQQQQEQFARPVERRAYVEAVILDQQVFWRCAGRIDVRPQVQFPESRQPGVQVLRRIGGADAHQLPVVLRGHLAVRHHEHIAGRGKSHRQGNVCVVEDQLRELPLNLPEERRIRGRVWDARLHHVLRPREQVIFALRVLQLHPPGLQESPQLAQALHVAAGIEGHLEVPVEETVRPLIVPQQPEDHPLLGMRIQIG